jgi:hypothetical protein
MSDEELLVAAVFEEERMETILHGRAEDCLGANENRAWRQLNRDATPSTRNFSQQ